MRLPRLHLFEFHDHAWFPPLFRNAITTCLAIYSAELGVETLIAPVLEELIHDTDTPVVVDLCSGSSGPYVRLCSKLRERGLSVKIVMTDIHPNPAAFLAAECASRGAIIGCRTPVDALNVPANLAGVRTLFNAFHHFPPEQARMLLKHACDSGQPIMIVEITGRSVLRILLTALGSFFLMFSTVFRMRPCFLMLFFTYVIPVIPLTFAWDAAVSCMRTYTTEELSNLAKSLNAEYIWRLGELKMRNSPFRLSYFTGAPVCSAVSKRKRTSSPSPAERRIRESGQGDHLSVSMG